MKKDVDMFKNVDIDIVSGRININSFEDRISDTLMELPINDFTECCCRIGLTGYMIWCEDSRQLWYAPNKACLDASFVYREDLLIKRFRLKDKAVKFCIDVIKDLCTMNTASVKCYMLHNTVTNSYVVYNKKSYTIDTYGKSTPRGCVIYKFRNRFQRDSAILYLNYINRTQDTYSNIRRISDDSAFIISDGSWSRGVVSAVCYYIDSTGISKYLQSIDLVRNPRGSLTAEVLGAYNSLLLCKLNNKKTITYFYDNAAVCNCLSNRHCYTEEIMLKYFELIDNLINSGATIKFVEVHPKSPEDSKELNKAILYFHNSCDAACREIHHILSQGYQNILLLDDYIGETLPRFVL